MGCNKNTWDDKSVVNKYFFMALAVAMLSLLKQCESNFNDKTKRHIPNQYVAITMTAIIVDTALTESLQRYLGVQ